MSILKGMYSQSHFKATHYQQQLVLWKLVNIHFQPVQKRFEVQANESFDVKVTVQTAYLCLYEK